jgi:hypothetical protein
MTVQRPPPTDSLSETCIRRRSRPAMELIYDAVHAYFAENRSYPCVEQWQWEFRAVRVAFTDDIVVFCGGTHADYKQPLEWVVRVTGAGQMIVE